MIKYTVIFPIFLFLSISKTLPLYRNGPDICNGAMEGKIQKTRDSIIERTKKMASSLESAIKKIKDTTQDFRRNIYEHINIMNDSSSSRKTILNDKDLRQYEQLVIMKKYPYLDMKELEMKLIPTNKNVRHNIGLQPNNEDGPSLREPMEDSISVEIINRGLSGVAIPTKHVLYLEQQLKNQTIMNYNSSDYLVQSLRNDVNEYVKRKNAEDMFRVVRIQNTDQNI